MKSLICVLLIAIFCVNCSQAEVENQAILEECKKENIPKSFKETFCPDPKSACRTAYARLNRLNRVNNGSIEVATEAIERCEIEKNVPKTLIAELYQERGGYEMYPPKDAESALKDFNNAISLNPQIIDSYMQRARAKSELGKYQEAIEDYNLVLKNNSRYSNQSGAYSERGKLYLKLKNYRIALSDFEQAEAISRGIVDQKDIALAKFAIGDKKGASEATKKAEEKNQKILEKKYSNQTLNNNSKQKEASEVIKKAEVENQKILEKKYSSQTLNNKSKKDVEELLGKFRAYNKYEGWEKALAKNKNFFNEYLECIKQLIDAGVNEDEIVSDIEEIKRFALDINNFPKGTASEMPLIIYKKAHELDESLKHVHSRYFYSYAQDIRNTQEKINFKNFLSICAFLFNSALILGGLQVVIIIVFGIIFLISILNPKK